MDSGRLMIRKRAILLKVINLINGKMRTPKIEALHRLINWFNLNHNSSIPLKGKDTTPLSESSWLSGMIDADGSFYLNWKLNEKDIPVGLIYYLSISQKQNYSRRPKFKWIKSFLYGRNISVFKNESNWYWKR